MVLGRNTAPDVFDAPVDLVFILGHAGPHGLDSGLSDGTGFQLHRDGLERGGVGDRPLPVLNRALTFQQSFDTMCARGSRPGLPSKVGTRTFSVFIVRFLKA